MNSMKLFRFIAPAILSFALFACSSDAGTSKKEEVKSEGNEACKKDCKKKCCAEGNDSESCKTDCKKACCSKDKSECAEKCGESSKEHVCTDKCGAECKSHTGTEKCGADTKTENKTN